MHQRICLLFPAILSARRWPDQYLASPAMPASAGHACSSRPHACSRLTPCPTASLFPHVNISWPGGWRRRGSIQSRTADDGSDRYPRPGQLGRCGQAYTDRRRLGLSRTPVMSGQSGRHSHSQPPALHHTRHRNLTTGNSSAANAVKANGDLRISGRVPGQLPPSGQQHWPQSSRGFAPGCSRPARAIARPVAVSARASPGHDQPAARQVSPLPRQVSPLSGRDRPAARS